VCFKPPAQIIEFLSTFKNYDIYIVVDDNSVDYKSLNRPNIQIIQIHEKDCYDTGFIHLTSLTFHKVTAWDKAVYYFSTLNKSYETIWFIEDDVFFYNEQTLLNIDAKYPTSDLLTARYIENATGHKNDWHWHRMTIHIPPPYYCAMVCACRLSKGLLVKIKEYAARYKTCFFIEALFSTICKQSNLLYDTPSELVNIVYRRDYTEKDIDTSGLYHPIKDIAKQITFREYLSSPSLDSDPLRRTP
jgi:hypothetical protein